MQVMQHMLAPFSPHADGLLWTSRHNKRWREAFLGTKRFREYVLSIRVSLGYRFGYRFSCGGPQKKMRKLESNSILSQCLPRPWHILCIPRTKFISKCRKASFLVVHYIAFHGFGPLGIQVSAQICSNEDVLFACFSKEVNPWNGAPMACKGITYFLLPFQQHPWAVGRHSAPTPPSCTLRTARPRFRHNPPQQEAKFCEDPPRTLSKQEPL